MSLHTSKTTGPVSSAHTSGVTTTLSIIGAGGLNYQLLFVNIFELDQ